MRVSRLLGFHDPKHYYALGALTWMCFWLSAAIVFSIPVVRTFFPVLGYSPQLINNIALLSWAVTIASTVFFYFFR